MRELARANVLFAYNKSSVKEDDSRLFLFECPVQLTNRCHFELTSVGLLCLLCCDRCV